MNKKFSIFVSFGILVFSIFIFISFIFSSGGIVDTFRKETQVRETKNAIEKIKEDNKKKLEIINRIKNDKDFKESLIKGLGININDGEYVFRFYQNEDIYSTKNDSNKNNSNSFLYLILLVSFVFIFIQVIIIVVMLNR